MNLPFEREDRRRRSPPFRRRQPKSAAGSERGDSKCDRTRRSSRIDVRLSFQDARVQLEIRDDGCGFAADSLRVSNTDHFGITGMRERIEQMGGSFTQPSAPGEGTSAIAVLPLLNSTA